MLQKLAATCAALLMVVSLVSPAAAGPSWHRENISFRTTLTSATTPTFASVKGAGTANTGIAFAESTVTAGRHGNAITLDTTGVFFPDRIVPLRANVTAAAADTTAMVLVLTFYPSPNTGVAEAITNTTSLVRLQGSNDGQTWFNTEAAADTVFLRFDEPGTNQCLLRWTSTVHPPIYSAGSNGGVTRLGWWGYNLYRFIIRSDKEGEWGGQVGWLREND